MPNLKLPVTTVEQARAYRERIVAALPNDTRFEPLMTLYLTDVTKPQEIAAAKACGFVHAVKYYPAGATTNSENGVTDLKRVYPVLAEMEKHDLPLLLHGEVTDGDVDVFDREAVFIERHLIPLARAFPKLRMVLEHVTTTRGRGLRRTGRVEHRRHHHRAPSAVEPQRHVRRRRPPARLLPAGAET